MKLLRYGIPGQEKPGMFDETGVLRDLSGLFDDIARPAFNRPNRHRASTSAYLLNLQLATTSIVDIHYLNSPISSAYLPPKHIFPPTLASDRDLTATRGS